MAPRTQRRDPASAAAANRKGKASGLTAAARPDPAARAPALLTDTEVERHGTDVMEEYEDVLRKLAE